MADNNDKLSLHISSKNMTTMGSGFVDVSANGNGSALRTTSGGNYNGPGDPANAPTPPFTWLRTTIIGQGLWKQQTCLYYQYDFFGVHCGQTWVND